MATTARTARPTYSTRNVLKVWRAASADHRARGARWYADAHDVAATIAENNGSTLAAHGADPMARTVAAAGILAALSPRQAWGPNVAAAARMIADGRASRCMSDQGRKVDAILAGAAPLEVLGGLKVRAFHALIVSAGASLEVCVDRHAHDVAAGRVCDDATRTALASPKTYAAIAECYIRAARIASREEGRTVTPSEVQAVTWLAWRASKGVHASADAHDVRPAARGTLASLAA